MIARRLDLPGLPPLARRVLITLGGHADLADARPAYLSTLSVLRRLRRRARHRSSGCSGARRRATATVPSTAVDLADRRRLVHVRPARSWSTRSSSFDDADRLRASALLIVAYSIGYMDGEDEEERRYFAYMALFVFSMLLLVQGGNLLMLLAGWGLVGLSSYLLIGFWHERPQAIAAAKKAFIDERVRRRDDGARACSC